MKIKSIYLSLIFTAVLCINSNLFAAAYGGGTGEPNNPYQIWTPEQLNTIGDNSADWGKHFKLMVNLNMSAYTGTQFNIIGSEYYDGSFTGVFDGNGYTIENLTYTTAEAVSQVGLFGGIYGATIKNLHLKNVNISSAGNYVGGLVGWNWGGKIEKCSVQGTVSGNETVGLLAGCNGWIYYTATGMVQACFAKGMVSGNSGVGGLVGGNVGNIVKCYADVAVAGTICVGGLTGENWVCSISDSYAMGRVVGQEDVGGLVGLNGNNGYDGTIENCYSIGSVNGAAYAGGLIGRNEQGNIESSFWDNQTSDQLSSAGGEGKATAQMQTQSTFTDAGWDFDKPVWRITGQDYPRLIWSDPDMDNNGKVNFADFSILAGQWMESECGFCDHADLTGDRGVNLLDLLVFAPQWLEEDKIGNHVFEIEMTTEWDYEYPDSGDDEYVMGVEVHTDDMVERIEFTTPAGNTFEIPNAPVTQYLFAEGYMEIGREFDNETGHYLWLYASGFVSPDSLSVYGDGLYTFTVYYADGYSQQTTAWFGIPGTTDPIPQPKQIPVFTSFDNGDTLTSPVTFAWQPCTDCAAEHVWLTVFGDDSEMEWNLPITATGLDEPLYLPEGWHEAELEFEVWYLSQNSDGITIDVGKYSECDYMITVESAPTPVPGKLLWQAVKAPYANGSMYYAIQPRITISDMKACSLKGPNMADFAPAQWVPQRGQWTLAIVPLTLSQLQQKSLGTWQLKLTDMNDNESIYSFTISGELQDSEFLPMPVMIEPYFSDSNVIAEHYTLRWDPNGAQADADALGVEITGSGFSYFSNTLDLSVTSWDPGWLEIGSAYCKVGYADYRPDMVNTPSLVSGPKINWESTMASVVSGPYCPFTVKYSLDFNDDDVIDLSDLAALTSYWLDPAPSSADLDDDGIVNFSDFAIFAQHWLEAN